MGYSNSNDYNPTYRYNNNDNHDKNNKKILITYFISEKV